MTTFKVEITAKIDPLVKEKVETYQFYEQKLLDLFKEALDDGMLISEVKYDLTNILGE